MTCLPVPVACCIFLLSIIDVLVVLCCVVLCCVMARGIYAYAVASVSSLSSMITGGCPTPFITRDVSVRGGPGVHSDRVAS